MRQLTIFDKIREEKVESLVSCLNLHRKQKDKFLLQDALELCDYPFYLVRVKNERQEWFNLVDQNGEIPENFCVNFRTWGLCFHDLKEWAGKHKKIAINS
jgi:hypothetical protein